MYSRFRPTRKNNYMLPKLAIGLIIVSLLLWVLMTRNGSDDGTSQGGQDTNASSYEANGTLTRLLDDLCGDKAHLLELADNFQTRTGWIGNQDTQQQLRALLVSRLVDNDLWAEAAKMIPGILNVVSVGTLDRLADAANAHKDFELEQKIDRRLQEVLLKSPADTPLLLSSIRRAAEACIAAGHHDEAIKIISVLDGPAVMTRINTQTLAAEAADLQMLRASVSEVKEPVLQQARNILDKAKWPSCPAASRLMLDEVANTLRDNPNLKGPALKELEAKLLRCRSLMMEFPDPDHRMPECYRLLSDLRTRLRDFDGSTKALELAAAFMESYGELSPQMELELYRVRSKAALAAHNEEKLEECYRWLMEHETDPAGTFTAMAYLIDHTEGEERAKLLERTWTFLDANPRIAQANGTARAKVAQALVEHYAAQEEYAKAIKWLRINRDLAEAANPDLTNGVALKAKYDLALMLRKAKQDGSASAAFYQICEVIEKMSEEQRTKLDAAAPRLYKDSVREYARTRYLMGDTARARAWCKKIKEGLPDKPR